MKKLVVLASVLSTAGSLTAGTIVPDLDDATAKYNSTVAESVAQTAPVRANGMTLAVQVTPTSADITASQSGTVNLIELGGTANGSAIMIKDGNYIFVTKSGPNNTQPVLEDTDGADNMIGITLGTATAGVDTKVWVSFDGANGVLVYSVGGTEDALAVSSTTDTWNWHGNNTLSFGEIYSLIGGRAGLSDLGAYASPPYPADNFAAALSQNFSGTVTRGQYFNETVAFAGPLPPASLDASLATGVDVELVWLTGLNAVSYNIYRSTNSGSYGAALATGVSGTTYIDSSTDSGKTYYYVVSTVSAGAVESAVSDEVSIQTDIVPPAAPVNLAIATNMAMFELTWDANTEPDLATYSVYRSTSSSSYGDPIAVGITTNAFNTGAPTVGADYYYTVTASDIIGNESAASAEVSGSITNADSQLFFVVDTGDIYGFNSIASNGWNTVDAGLVTNGTLLANVLEYSDYQAFANLPNWEVYGVDAVGDVLKWDNVADFLSGEGAATTVATGTYAPEGASTERIHGASYDPNTKGFYAVLESETNPPDGDVVLYSNITAFVDNTPYVTNVSTYGGNVANFYYGGDDVPNTTTAYTNLAGAAYMQIPGGGKIEAWVTLEDYIATPDRRTFEVDGFSGDRTIKGAVAVLPRITAIGDLSILQLNAMDFELSWPAEELGTYSVQEKNNLQFGNWNNIVTDIEGVDGTLSVTTTVTEAQMFYRVSGE